MFKSFHEAVVLDVSSGKLVMDDGDLQWDDWIQCTLRCPECGKRFELQCETYHGRGGSWNEIAST